MELPFQLYIFQIFNQSLSQKSGALITYSFQNPWSSGWSLNNKPGFVIGGDENNGSDPTDNDSVDNSNSQNHDSEGQQFLKLDASVTWGINAWSGIGDDNVYTSNTLGEGSTMKPGDKGYLSTLQKDGFDSVLVPVVGTNTGVMSGSKQWTVSKAK